MNSTIELPSLVTSDELAGYLRISPKTVRNFSKQTPGRVQIGRLVRWDAAEFMRFAKGRQMQRN